MKWGVAPVVVFVVSLSAVIAGAQPGNTGALPPVEPTQPPGAAPPAAPGPGEQPPAPPPSAPPPTAPPPVSAPPPAYPPPGYYGYAPPPPPPPPKERPTRTVSVTFSPLHLLIGPIFEGNVELRPIDHMGVAVIGGYGTVRVDNPNTGGTESFDAYELGGQLLAYPMEPFDKLMLGAELLYVHVSSDTLNDQNIKGVGVGYAVGPLAGYKLLTDGGFTFVVQGGFEYIFVQAETSDTSGNSDSGKDSRFIPLLNLNIGWSF